MRQLSRGILISVEGIDGSGKSTLTQGLYQKLHDGRLPVYKTREPGGTPLGSHIRAIVQQQDVNITPQAEFMLFATDRAQHFSEVILPKLAQNMIVISDRMADSSLAYQGFGRGVDRTMMQKINSWVMQNRMPDITFYLKVDPVTGVIRLQQRGKTPTAFEQEHASFMRDVADGFDTLFTNNPRVITLDGSHTQDALINTAYTATIEWIQKKL